MYEFYWKFLSLSSGEKIGKSVCNDEVTTIEFSGTLFWNKVYTKVQYGAVLLEKTDNI